MFTGIIRAIGRIEAAAPRGQGLELQLAGIPEAWGSRVGDSIAVQGTCLTIEELGGGTARFYLSAETLARTAARSWEPGARVHLEAALRAGDRFDGHMVQGHVDGVGRLLAREVRGEDLWLSLSLPEGLREAVFPKGSVTVDGVSLTVNALGSGCFEVNLIPHTLQETLLGDLAVGDAVHLEADPVAKQVAWVLAQRMRMHAPGGQEVRA